LTGAAEARFQSRQDLAARRADHRIMISTIPLSEPELEELQNVLLSGEHDAKVELSGLHGLLTAVVSGPKPVTPNEWLPVVWGAGEAAFDDAQQGRRILSLVMRQMNDIASTLMNNPRSFSPLLLVDTSSTPVREYAGGWCHGYLAGVLLRESDWEPFLGEEPIENGLSLFAIGSEDFPNSRLPDAIKPGKLQRRLADAAIGIHEFFLERRDAS
jgi:uncharacterized protein